MSERRRGEWELNEKVKGLSKKIYITHRYRQQCGDSQREKGCGGARPEQKVE